MTMEKKKWEFKLKLTSTLSPFYPPTPNPTNVIYLIGLPYRLNEFEVKWKCWKSHVGSYFDFKNSNKMVSNNVVGI